MNFIKTISSRIKRPVFLLSITALIVVPGMLRCSADVDAQAQTNQQAVK